MSESTTAKLVHRPAEQAEQRWFFGGGVHSWLATAEETAGAFLLFSDAMEKGKRTPLHTHPTDDAGTPVVYVIAGGKVLRRVVTVGITDEDAGLVQIASGVQVGDVVVVGPIEGLTEGAPVEVLGQAADTSAHGTR